jgi:hypothetical protein
VAQDQVHADAQLAPRLLAQAVLEAAQDDAHRDRRRHHHRQDRRQRERQRQLVAEAQSPEHVQRLSQTVW